MKKTAMLAAAVFAACAALAGPKADAEKIILIHQINILLENFTQKGL